MKVRASTTIPSWRATDQGGLDAGMSVIANFQPTNWANWLDYWSRLNDADPDNDLPPPPGGFRAAHWTERVGGFTTNTAPNGGGSETNIRIPVVFGLKLDDEDFLPVSTENGPHILTYTLTGTAVEGVHYTDNGNGTILVADGSSTAEIVLTPADDYSSTGGWWSEKSVIVTLVESAGIAVGQWPEYRIYLRPYFGVRPSLLTWAAADQDLAANANVDLGIQFDAVQRDDAFIWYTATHSSSPDMDGHYTLTAPGVAKIEGGDTVTTSGVPFNIAFGAGAPSGGTVTIQLDHPKEDGSDQNLWTQTDAFTQDYTDIGFAGDPSSVGSGGGTWQDTDGDGEEDPAYPNAGKGGGTVTIRQDALNDPFSDNPFWDLSAETYVLEPTGEVASAWLMHPQAQNAFYWRISFEGETDAGTPPAGVAQDAHNLFGFYVNEIPHVVNPQRDAEFLKLIVRNRTSLFGSYGDIQTGITLYKYSTDAKDSRGGDSVLWSGGSRVTGSTVDIGPFTFALWDWENLHPLDQWGVEGETDQDGRTHIHVWCRLYREASPGYPYRKVTMVGGPSNKDATWPRVTGTASSVNDTGQTLTDDAGLDFAALRWGSTDQHQINGTDDTGEDPWIVENLNTGARGVIKSVSTTTITMRQETASAKTGLAQYMHGGYRLGDTAGNNGWRAGDSYDVMRASVLQVGDIQNNIMRATPWSSSDSYNGLDSSSTIQGGSIGARGKGYIGYLPHYTTHATDPLVSDQPPGLGSLLPGRPWERVGNWEGTRGPALRDSTGKTSIVITVT